MVKKKKRRLKIKKCVVCGTKKNLKLVREIASPKDWPNIGPLIWVCEDCLEGMQSNY